MEINILSIALLSITLVICMILLSLYLKRRIEWIKEEWKQLSQSFDPKNRDKTPDLIKNKISEGFSSVNSQGEKNQQAIERVEKNMEEKLLEFTDFHKKIKEDLQALHDKTEASTGLIEKMTSAKEVESHISQERENISNVKDSLMKLIQGFVEDEKRLIKGSQDSIKDMVGDYFGRIEKMIPTTSIDKENNPEVFTKEVVDEFRKDFDSIRELVGELKVTQQEVTPPGPKTKAVTLAESTEESGFTELFSWYDKYNEKLNFLAKEGYDKDRQLLERAQEKYEKWKSFMIKLYDTFDNALHYEFFEIVEGFSTKNKFVMLFPLDLKHKEKNIEQLQNLTKAIISILEKNPDNIKDSLMTISNVNVRTGSELDYRIDDSDLLPMKVRTFQKEKFNELLLYTKQFSSVKSELSGLLNRALKEEKNIYPKLKEIDSKALIEKIFDRSLSQGDKNSEIKRILDDGDHCLRENFRDRSRAVELSDKLEKSYFKFLKNNFFNILNGLEEADRKYKIEIADSYKDYDEQLRGWAKIYSKLISLFVTYLKENLNIERIECSRGDDFNHDIHSPYLEAEPDKELLNNKIKTVCHHGYYFKDSNEQRIIKPSDVIVVRNL